MSLAELAPHRFTVDDLQAMVGAGVLERHSRVELIEGELIEMPDDGELHVMWSSALGFWLFRALEQAVYSVGPGTNLILSERNAPKPDYFVYPAALRPGEVRGPDVLLAVEEAVTSLRRDLGWKADLYARHGVRDYWVIDLQAKRLHVHRAPRAGQYTEVTTHEADEAVEALLIPGLNLRLDQLLKVN